MRSLLCLLLPAVLATPRPRLPGVFPLPAYEAPRLLVDGLKLDPGKVRSDGEDTCYDPPALRRVALTLTLGERLSDDRARAAWRAGWLAADGAWADRFDAEREERVRAEATRDAVTAAAEGAADESAWAAFWTRAGWATGGGLAGILVGLLISD